MNQLLRVFLAMGAMISFVSAQAGEKSLASLSLYVFSAGEPVERAALWMNERQWGETDHYGSIHVDAGSGDYQGVLRLQDKSEQSLSIRLENNERALIIVSRPESDSEFTVEIESSRGLFSVKAPQATSDDNARATNSGTISGTIRSLQSGVSVKNASIYVSGVRGAIKTDDEGNYEISLPVGIHNVSVVHAEYSSQTLRGLEVKFNETLTRNIELTPSGIQLAEIIVAAPALEGGFNALMDEQRNTSAVAEVIGADQMSNSGDSDAAGALKRVTGLTLIDGKYIYVRGLGERYSSTTLNGSGLPSPDPARRVVPLDLFPTGILESVVTQKTFSPDMPGDFGGGTVQLRTRGTPEEKLRKISVSLGGNSLATFQQGKTYDGGSVDWLGVDDGGRAFPPRLDQLTLGGSRPLSLLSSSEKEQAGESLVNNYAIRSLTMMPDMGIKANMADRFEAYDADWGWGYNLAVNYKNQWRYREEQRATFGLDGIGGLELQDELSRQQTENEIDLGGMLNLALELGESHVIESTTLLTRKTSNTVLIDDAYQSENDFFLIDTTLEWVERQLFSQQFSGRHLIVDWSDLQVDWFTAFAAARRYEPDTRFYRYQLREDGRYGFSQGGQTNERSFEDLNDTSLSAGLDLTLPIYDFFSRQAKLKAGFDVESKQRDSEFLRFLLYTDWSVNDLDPEIVFSETPETILTPENIDANGFVLRNATLPTDNYTASQSILAGYLMGELMLSPRLKLMTGARLETASQEVVTFQLDSPDEKNIARLDTTDVLPAFSGTWSLSHDQQLRIAASRTLNRPDFKELSEAPYIDPETRDVVIGNPSLKRATITNLDARWEWYLTRFETFSAAAFYKAFDQPIERIIRLGAGGIHSFANAESAVNYGVELQSRFWLSRLLGSAWSRFYLESNLSLIQSQVNLGAAGAQQTNSKRALQGQAPWVLNLMLGYENLIARTNASLLFNLFGERISSVGTSGLPDAYDQPVPLLDFVFSREIYEGSEDNLKLKFKLKNLLDQNFKTLRGNEIEKLYRKGRSLSLSLDYKWK